MKAKERRRAIRECYMLAHEWIQFSRQMFYWAGAHRHLPDTHVMWLAAACERLTLAMKYREIARELRNGGMVHI